MRNRHRASVPIFLALLLALASVAGAWEYAYGPPFTRDQAFRRVAPVVHCPQVSPGYIAVGTLDEGGLNPDLYVVYTNAAGGPGWEFIYDVQGLGLPDEGMALVELPNGGGFVILSNTQINGVWAPALIHIPCNGGQPLWSYIYPDANIGRDLRGRDLIRAANGDFAVAGSWFNGVNEDAFLMRTDAAALLMWNRTYEMGGVEAFNALTEAFPQTGQLVGDLVAVGRYDKDNGVDQQGLVARVGGLTGGIGLAPQCLAQHGDPHSQEVYNSVTRLASNQYAGELAMIGTTTAPGLLSDVWMTRGNPCALTAQTRIGNPLGPTPSDEEGYDLKEVAGPVIGPNGGMLAIAGSYAPAAGGPFDGTFHLVSIATLMPLGTNGRIFGDHGGGDEVFYSLAQDPGVVSPLGRYILAGYTTTPWTLGDPRDLYLAHHDPVVRGCEKDWSPIGVALTWPQDRLRAELQEPARRVRVDTRWRDLSTGIPICP